MGNVWTDLRNHMKVDVVKAELLTKLNYNMSCEHFDKFLSEPQQAKLLRKAMSQEKYSWRAKNEVKMQI